MLILSQDNRAIYDTEKSVSITVKGNIVYLLNVSGELAYPLGEYQNEERATEVVEQIFMYEGCQDKFEMPVV